MARLTNSIVISLKSSLVIEFECSLNLVKEPSKQKHAYYSSSSSSFPMVTMITYYSCRSFCFLILSLCRLLKLQWILFILVVQTKFTLLEINWYQFLFNNLYFILITIITILSTWFSIIIICIGVTYCDIAYDIVKVVLNQELIWVIT